MLTNVEFGKQLLRWALQYLPWEKSNNSVTFYYIRVIGASKWLKYGDWDLDPKERESKINVRLCEN